MPKFYPLDQAMRRLTQVEWTDPPSSSNIPTCLIVRGVADIGPLEWIITEDAARELLARLTERLPIDDSR